MSWYDHAITQAMKLERWSSDRPVSPQRERLARDIGLDEARFALPKAERKRIRRHAFWWPVR